MQSAVLDDFAIFAQGIEPLVEWARPDWILFVDTDEFWLPASGNIKETAGLKSSEVIQVKRFNLPLIRQQDGTLSDPLLALDRPRDLLMIAQRRRLDARDLAAEPEFRWIEAEILPKVLVRPSSMKGVTVGAHDIVGAPGVRRLEAKDLVIAHAPFTTFDRFSRKVGNLIEKRAIHGDRFEGQDAWHWRRWMELYESGALSAEFESQLIAAEQVAALAQDGILTPAAAYFSRGRKAPGRSPLR